MPPAGWWPTPAPAVGVVQEAQALHADNAEALAGGRQHLHPALQADYHHGTQLFQAYNLGRDVVGLEVDEDAALVLHALDLHDGLVRRRLQYEIVAAAARMLRPNGNFGSRSARHRGRNSALEDSHANSLNRE